MPKKETKALKVYSFFFRHKKNLFCFYALRINTFLIYIEHNMIPHKTTGGKVTKQRKPRKLKDRGFPNLLLNRNVISRPNMVWAIDGTFLDITLNGQAGTKHYLLSAVDPATNKLIFTKSSYVGDKKAKTTFTTSFIMKLIENALVNERISQPLMIHVDRAAQFTSKKFVEFVDKHPLLIGSQTAGGQPNQNAVIERMHRTFKNQLKGLELDLPKDVKKTRDLQAFCDKRRNKMNSAALYTKNNGLTVEESCQQLSRSTLVEPEVLLARECKMFLQKQDAALIKDYRNDVRFSALAEPVGPMQMLDKIQASTMANQHMIANQDQNIKGLKDDVRQVLEFVTPKKKSTNKAQLLRDPVPKTMLETIINAPKPKGSHELSWARFQVTAVLLFFSGLRISELAPVTEKMILNVLENGKMTFYQSKVNKYRTIRFTNHGIDAIKLVFDKNQDIIFKQQKVLFPVENTKNLTSEKFTRSINKFLNMFSDKENQKISSHSFRIGFVTNSLKHTSAQNAQQLIGHADIRSTMKYSRYELDPERQDNILNQMFD